jgi:hypothetical protein
MSAQLRAARYYAERLGLCPLPLQGKAPRIPWKDRPVEPPDSEQILAWWKRWVGSSVGVIIGDRHAVLDVDEREGVSGLDSLHGLEREHGELSDTWRALTPSGGLHVWFSVPPGVGVATRDLAPGVQLRTGRHVMAMPPAHRREWELSPREVRLAELPGWIVDLAPAGVDACP